MSAADEPWRGWRPAGRLGTLSGVVVHVTDSEQYTWEDTKPVRALYVTVLVAQCVGGAIGAWAAMFPSVFENIWAGIAMASLPGFLVGLAIQAYLQPGSIVENRGMVCVMGMLALVMTVAVFVVLPLNESPGR
jgi:hypothetical protein